MRHVFFRSLLCGILLAPTLALANSQDDLLAALAAYNANDSVRLSRLADTMKGSPLHVYPDYWLTLKALEQNNDAQVTRFLATEAPSALRERIQREWLKKLGKRGDWRGFEAEWSKLPQQGRDEETQCYGDIQTLRHGRTPDNLDRFLAGRSLPDGCNTLIQAAAQRGLIDQNGLWRRLRALLAGNFTSAARALSNDNQMGFDATLLNNPSRADLSTRSGKEALLFAIETKARTNLDAAAANLTAVSNALGANATGFAWGQLALMAARKLQCNEALNWFNQADPKQLNNDQWEWWARCDLRSTQWPALLQVIQAMPSDLAAKPVWQYWQGRALQNAKRYSEANALFASASTKHNYYGLLALGELGDTLSPVPDKINPNAADTATIKADPTIQRSLALFDIAESARKPELRSAAQTEWRWAMRDRSDMQLLAAAEMARDAGFYDMAIYSAERTKVQHDFSLRFLMPYRDITQRYADQLKIDDAWVYGLIRQESRFISMARSGVGASGLMQLMPKTARWAAQKMGLGNTLAMNQIETNIQLGTWYLKYVLDALSDNPILATAAYNAGPKRARAWQGAEPMEGAIYAETIPFSETRQYVQKVMANAEYYAIGMGQKHTTLEQRMGHVPGRAAP